MNATNSNHYLQLSLNQQSILVPLNQIEIILQLPYLQDVPTEDGSCEGLLNYHGYMVPVFSLFKLIDDELSEKYDLDTPLVLCRVKGERIGLLVSQVVDVTVIPQHKIQPKTFNKIKPYVNGIYPEKTQSFWLLDIEKLIEYHQIELRKLVGHG